MITTALLADRPDAISALAAGYRSEWPDWYGPTGPGDAEADLVERAAGARLPFAVVALDGEVPVGAAAVSARSIASHVHLTPWLGGLWVAPGLRRQGIASSLIERACDAARTRGVARLYVATKRRRLFERLGWTWRETTGEGDQTLAILARDLA